MLQRGNPQAQKQYQIRMAQVWKKHDCNPLKSLAGIGVQIPLFIGFFGALRSLSGAKVRTLLGWAVLSQPETAPPFALPA